MDMLDANKKMLWEYYRHFDENLKHLGEIQSKYRLLGSSWLIFGLGSIGYIIREVGSIPDFSKQLIFITIIGLTTGIGLYVIYIQDIFVYQNMIDGIYIEKRALETAQPWLPQISNNIRSILKGRGKKLILMFYQFGIGITLLISNICFIIFIYNSLPILFTLSIIVILLLIFIAIIRFLYKKTESTEIVESKDGLLETRITYYKIFLGRNT